MIRALLIAVVFLASAWLAAFVAIFCAMTFGTFRLDPEEGQGSRWGDVLAIIAFVSLYALALFAAWSRGLFERKAPKNIERHG